MTPTWGFSPSIFYMAVLSCPPFIHPTPLQPLAALPTARASHTARCVLSSQEGGFDLVHILSHAPHLWTLIYAQVHLGIRLSPAQGTSKFACVI